MKNLITYKANKYKNDCTLCGAIDVVNYDYPNIPDILNGNKQGATYTICIKCLKRRSKNRTDISIEGEALTSEDSQTEDEYIQQMADRFGGAA